MALFDAMIEETSDKQAGPCCFQWKYGICEPPRPPCRFRHDMIDDGVTPCCFGATCRFGHAKRVAHETQAEKEDYWRQYRAQDDNTIGKSPALRDATLLRSQLEPFPTAILRTRLATNFGEDHRQLDTLQRGEIMRLLLKRYEDCPRRIVRVQGTPVDRDLCQLLLEALETWSECHRTNTRPSIDAQSYMILRSPVEFEQKSSNMARKAAKKLQDNKRLWDLAKRAIESVDPEYAESFSALAITKGFTGSPHIDKQNTGPFYGFSLGDFHDGTGGVCVEVDFKTVAQVNTKERLGKVDGRYPHWVAPYKGTRYSLIYYSTWQEYQQPGPAFFGQVVDDEDNLT